MNPQEAIQFLSHNDLKISDRQTWTDLGCGNGTFTLALADLLSMESVIYGMDNNKPALENIPDRHNSVSIFKVHGDFTIRPIAFNLDGILMANSLHYVKDKESLIRKLKAHLNPAGKFLIVEYEMRNANAWVPFPITFLELKKLFNEQGFSSVEKIHERPSNYNRVMMYSAIVQNSMG